MKNVKNVNAELKNLETMCEVNGTRLCELVNEWGNWDDAEICHNADIVSIYAGQHWLDEDEIIEFLGWVSGC
jgi:hypothetical protein